MRNPWTLSMLPMLAACGSSPQVVDTDTQTGPLEEARIDRVEPAYGTNGGGEFVTLTGGPFATNSVVTFGGIEATVLESTSDQIQVSTPLTDKTDWVMVKVTAPDGTEVKKKKAYQYWEDGNGLTGLWGEIYRMDYLGNYWTAPGTQGGPYTPPPNAQIRMVFLNPSEIEYSEVWAPYFDWCEVDYNANLQASSIPTGMDAMTIVGDGGESVRLLPSTETTNYFDRLEVEPLLLSPGTVYGLESGASNGTWPAFGVDDLVTMPDRPNVTMPLLDEASPPIAGPEIDLRWDVSPTSSYMALIISRTTDNGATIAERATCLLADDGQHVIPEGLWSEWVPGEFVMVQLGRISLTERTMPHNRSRSELVGVYWVYGAIQAM